MEIDKQDSHRNRQLSRTRLSRGEVTYADDKPAAGVEYKITTVPKGAILTKFVVQLLGSESPVAGTIKVGTVSKAFSVTQAAPKIEALTPITFNTDQVVTIKVDADLPSGTLFGAVEYINLDNVTGETVAKVE